MNTKLIQVTEEDYIRLQKLKATQEKFQNSPKYQAGYKRANKKRKVMSALVTKYLKEQKKNPKLTIREFLKGGI